MRRPILRWLLTAPLMLGATLVLTGCEKGPAEKAGANLDNAAKNVGDAINPKGPAEKAGQNVDKALGR